jgi:8-oxo-dGTP pyrophosphatase MutT (NUDIX family)
METTRHFTASVYLVHEGATALHRHPTLGIRLPPGGHVDRDELPHETALREAREETGLDPTLLTEHREVVSETARSIPRPRHLMLADVNRFGERVGHQHIDHVYFATVDSRRLDPADGEEPAAAWEWYAPAALRGSDLDSDVRELGLEAIETAAATP